MHALHALHVEPTLPLHFVPKAFQGVYGQKRAIQQHMQMPRATLLLFRDADILNFLLQMILKTMFEQVEVTRKTRIIRHVLLVSQRQEFDRLISITEPATRPAEICVDGIH